MGTVTVVGSYIVALVMDTDRIPLEGETAMMRLIFALTGLLVLAGCGVDGEPLTPTYSTTTTIGYNSRTGPFSNTTVGVQFGG